MRALSCTLIRPGNLTVSLASLLWLGALGAPQAARAHGAEPDLRCEDAALALARGHAHNDYEHERPLFDALDQGFTSVEADVWLVDGELRVAHDLEDAQPGRTIETLYLEPLRDLVRAQRGRVYPCFPHSLQLLVDIKSEAEPTYRALHAVLSRYARILTAFTPHGVREAAVTVVLSGNRPRELLQRQRVRYAGYDGRAADLGSDADASFIPLISDRWTSLFTWVGVGPMPVSEQQALQAFVDTAHQNQQRVRFWATPEDVTTREAVWTALIEAGVDYINTDDLAGLRTFLLDADPQPDVPEVDWFAWPRCSVR
jgi:hypothetical protein